MSVIFHCFQAVSRNSFSRFRHFAIHGEVIGFPSNDLQVEYKYAVRDRHQKQSDKGSDAKSTDLRVTKGLPQRTAFECKREKSQDRCSRGDHYGANSLDARVGQRLDQWLVSDSRSVACRHVSPPKRLVRGYCAQGRCSRGAAYII
jgi:hypothetical protein